MYILRGWIFLQRCESVFCALRPLHVDEIISSTGTRADSWMHCMHTYVVQPATLVSNLKYTWHDNLLLPHVNLFLSTKFCGNLLIKIYFVNFIWHYINIDFIIIYTCRFSLSTIWTYGGLRNFILYFNALCSKSQRFNHNLYNHWHFGIRQHYTIFPSVLQLNYDGIPM